MKYLLTSLLLACALLQVAAQPGQEEQLAEKYFQEGEYQSAYELFEKIQRKNPTESLTLKVAECLEKLNHFEEAIKFLDKSQKTAAPSVIYPVVKAEIMEKSGDIKGADRVINEVITRQLLSQGDFIRVGSYLYQGNRLEWAGMSYLQARKTLRDPFIFSNEMGHIYSEQGQYEAATLEFLNDYYQTPENLNTANLEILTMVQPNAQVAIEKALLREVDKRQTDLGLRSILYDYYVQVENFYEAFTQVKAIDRLFKEDGERVFNFALTMRNNQRFDISNKALDYLIERNRGSGYFFQAHFEKAINGELAAFEQVPVDVVAIRAAVDAYGKLLDEFGRRPQYFEPIYRRAKLMVFYLNDLPTALRELEDLTAQRQLLKPEDWASATLLEGDILLIQQSYNKAKLLYTEVSEVFKDRQIGAMARYKLAQLAYFKGEFSLSSALLGAIKENTSNDISNDAIRLNLVIMDNTGIDTSTAPLRIFANAQLLVYQRRYDESLVVLDSLSADYPTHSLQDEILWEKANIFLKKNDLTTAERYLDELLTTHGEGIYGDDALYTKAKTYDYTLKNPETAMKLYLSFLTRFPGSLYSVEVRKRIRDLRAAAKADGTP